MTRLASAGLVLARLSEQVDAIQLHPSGLDGAPDEDALIPTNQWQAAMRFLESSDWRYRLGRGRRRPGGQVVSFMWADGSQLFIRGRIGVDPLPSWWFRGLEGRLRSTRPGGTVDPSLSTLWLGLESCRPGPAKMAARRQLSAMLDLDASGRDRLVETADRLGYGRLARAVLTGLDTGQWRGIPAPDSRRRRADWSWRVSAAADGPPDVVERPARSGAVPLRARLSGVETTVPPTVFVPTPDAETLVDMVLAALPEKSPGVVVDCGAGAGAIALGVALARPDATVFALELSRRATRAARRNVRRSRLSNVQACRGSLLSPLPTEVHGSVQVLVANLPFYPKERYAAIGGVARSGIQGLEPDGLGLHRMLIAQAADVMAPRSSMILQMFQEQWPALTTELAKIGFVPAGEVSVGPFVLARAVRNSGLGG